MHNLSFWLTTSNKIWFFSGISTSHHGDFALKLLRHWFIKLHHCRLLWISLISNLIAVLDALEASLLKFLSNSEGAGITEGEVATKQHPQYNNSTPSHNYCGGRSIRHSSFDFQNLHGEGMSVELFNGDFPKSQLLHPLSSTSFRFIQDTRRQANSVPDNVIMLWKVKASCVDFLVCCSRRLTFSWAIQKPTVIQHRADPVVAILHVLIDTFSAHQNSATIRLSCILVVQACDACKLRDYEHDGLDILLSLIWSRAVWAATNSKAKIFALFYCELIIVCSRYDNPVCLMKAMIPLIVALNETVEAQSRSELRRTTSQDCSTFLDDPQMMRKCFALILSRRGRILFSAVPAEMSKNCDTFKNIKVLLTDRKSVV